MQPNVQANPADATDEELKREIKFLRRLEKKYGTADLRLLMIVKLNAELTKRGHSYA